MWNRTDSKALAGEIAEFELTSTDVFNCFKGSYEWAFNKWNRQKSEAHARAMCIDAE